MFKNCAFLLFLSFVISPQVALSKGKLTILNEELWSETLTGEWMLEFYAPWCPACQRLEALWNELAEWSEDLGIKVGNVDVTVNPGLSGRFMISALPTIFHVKDGVFRQYTGARDRESFISFVEEKKWQSIDPLPSWKSPQSYQMTLVSSFFKLSMLLRNIHNSIVEDYGIPYWGSYIIFGILTVIVGALLGLFVVFFIDLVCPSRKEGYRQLPKSTPHEREQDGVAENQGEEFTEKDVDKGNDADGGNLRRREGAIQTSKDQLPSIS